MASLQVSYTPRRKYPWGAKRSGFQGEDTYWYVEFLKNCTNAVDEPFYEATEFDLFGTDVQEVIHK